MSPGHYDSYANPLSVCHLKECFTGENTPPLPSLSLGAVSNSDVGGHGFPLFSVSCSFDDLDFTDFQQLAEAFHEVQPWSSSASLALNFPSDYDVLKSQVHVFS